MVTPFLPADIAPFLALAEDERWVCDSWEFHFLLRHFPQGCFVCREARGALGYITSARYGKSGWIGNLLVHPDARKRGIGRELMERALGALSRYGVETVWLTASEAGAALYRKFGFLPAGAVNRWLGRGEGGQVVRPVPLDMESVVAVDRAGWGGPREALLRITCERGRLYSNSGGFLCCQQWKDCVQIGPWGCLSGLEAEQLLDQALAGAGDRVLLDVPAENRAAATLLVRKGFKIKGSSALMYLGAAPPYRPQYVFALASMGGMG